ncbi:M20/M25/M40 family metallo-hydrolase [Pendulispora rubella]|uniref:M20/M25/M40 family metallo-hydrolase n=1 Tax=Pendulispora rubella TaxID=2741070 RepID=A0ABZ2LGH4_9BACT
MNHRAEDAAHWLEGKTTEMEEALRPLVEQNSFTDNADGGRLVGARLREQTFAIHGLRCAVHPSSRYADHLVFSSDGAAGASPIALVGHLDTVFPPGTFEGYRRDGSLARGPGVLDMKGGLVVVAFALRAVAETAGLDAIPPVRLVIVADEEVGSPEGYAIIQAAARGSASALVFEAGRKADAIITRRKGTAGITAIASGKAAHAGANHRDGINAIWALSRFIDKAQGWTDYDRGITVNCGKISGGQGKNTVPDHAEALFDARFVSNADADRLVAAFHEAAAQIGEAGSDVAGASIRIEGGIARRPLERTDASAALLRAYGDCARVSGLGDGEAALIGGGSDASTTADIGIPSIDGLGPRGTGFHTKDELIEVDTLVPKAQALARYLLAVLAVMVLAGCGRARTPEEEPTPEIRVVPGAAQRSLWIGHGVDAGVTDAGDAG